jgi:hypothetical protein
MKKQDLAKKVTYLNIKGSVDQSRTKRASIKEIVEHLESRIVGKKGAEVARDRFAAKLDKMYPENVRTLYGSRLQRWESASAEALAEKAGMTTDEHGSWRGDHISVSGLSFVGHWESAAAPYWDMGGEGLGLVSVTRTRQYAKSSNWRPSSVSTSFLVGKNEAGTYFSHPVSPNCTTVWEAMDWIWNGKSNSIIQRQGDIALIGGNGGPKMAKLPWGHKIEGDKIVHATHPDLPMPSKPGERIIVGRRASDRATSATRD